MRHLRIMFMVILVLSAFNCKIPLGPASSNDDIWALGEIQIESFKASKTIINEGEMIVLSWKVKNASTVQISPIKRNFPPIGNYFVMPEDLTTYTLTAYQHGRVTKSATITIEVDGWWMNK